MGSGGLPCGPPFLSVRLALFSVAYVPGATLFLLGLSGASGLPLFSCSCSLVGYSCSYLFLSVVSPPVPAKLVCVWRPGVVLPVPLAAVGACPILCFLFLAAFFLSSLCSTPHIAARTLAHWTSALASFSFLSSAAVCRGAFLLLLCRSSPCPLAVASLLSAAASLRPRLPLPCWASSSSLLSCLILSLLARTLSSTVVVLAWCAFFPSFSVCVFSGLPVCFSVSSVPPPPLWCVSPPVLL